MGVTGEQLVIVSIWGTEQNICT